MSKKFRIQIKLLVSILITMITIGILLACNQVNQEVSKSSPSTKIEASSPPSPKPSSISISPKPQPSVETPVEARMTVAEMAQLTPNHVQELMLLAEQAEKKEPGRKFRIIVPTYIPSGFQVISVETNSTVRIGYPSYDIKYQDSNSGACFSVSGISGGFGGAVEFIQTAKVLSESLGIVVVSISSPSETSKLSQINLRDQPIIRNDRAYSFNSGYDREYNCTTMNFGSDE